MKNEIKEKKHTSSFKKLNEFYLSTLHNIFQDENIYFQFGESVL